MDPSGAFRFLQVPSGSFKFLQLLPEFLAAFRLKDFQSCLYRGWHFQGFLYHFSSFYMCFFPILKVKNRLVTREHELILSSTDILSKTLFSLSVRFWWNELSKLLAQWSEWSSSIAFGSLSLRPVLPTQATLSYQ